MDKTTTTSASIGRALSKAISEDQRSASDILILHFKSGMTVESLSTIFSMDKSEVSGIIANFESQFTNVDNLNSVVDCMVRMKKQTIARKSAPGEDTLSDKDREIAELRRQLKEAEIKAEAYLEMVKLAEQNFKIPIRKKYGAK